MEDTFFIIYVNRKLHSDQMFLYTYKGRFKLSRKTLRSDNIHQDKHYYMGNKVTQTSYEGNLCH